LVVVPVRHWQRAQWQMQTGIPWKNPSPNMRSVTAAALYPGVGLLEFTNVSVGRGTETPFEVFGAPWINAPALVKELESLQLPGVSFRKITYTPKASVFANQKCHGVQFLLYNRHAFDSVDLGMALARSLQKLHPGTFEIAKMDRLLCHERTRRALQDGKTLREIRALWQPELGEFAKRRAAVLLYE
jgi:uncharacterized protein YbbC (DUF1343 family)